MTSCIPVDFYLQHVRLISNQYDDDAEDARQLQLLERELRISNQASTCADVARYYGVTFFDGDCLICLELLDISLDRLYKIVHRLARRRFCENVLGLVGITVLRALNCLKQLVIMHRGMCRNREL